MTELALKLQTTETNEFHMRKSTKKKKTQVPDDLRTEIYRKHFRTLKNKFQDDK